MTAAEVTSSSALLWTRAPKAGSAFVEVARNAKFRRLNRAKVSAPAANDRTVHVTARHLRSNTRYFYRFRQGKSRSPVGRFVTAPKAGARKSFTFAYSGDADAQSAQYSTTPFYNNFQAYRSMAKENNAFNINLGDTIYSDTEVGGSTVNGVFVPGFVARTVPEKWAKYKMNLGLSNLRRVRASTGMFNHWDDHEFINDFSLAENGQPIYDAGQKAFRDYMPVTFSKSRGIYRTVRWGKNAELFFLDERSFRSAKADDACINPQTNAPDLAPTLPPAQRAAYSAIAPSLSAPVSAQCLATINDPSRTVLGAAQLQRFTNAVKASKAKWKIIVNEYPIQQFYALPYDRWDGYEPERQKVLQTLSSVKNAVVLTTDTHANLFHDAHFHTLEAGGVQESGVPEMVTGPAATKTFRVEINEAVGRPDAGDLVRGIFKAPPPNGVGMDCAVIGTYSYTQVKVTPTQLTLSPKDLNGKPLKESEGNACGPFKLAAK
ncbi:MAG: alkaline phosphatase [Thermoleophilaceae bacterium]|nr:alkaline phosphatase [Thermoleophilaceae bacterium]